MSYPKFDPQNVQDFALSGVTCTRDALCNAWFGGYLLKIKMPEATLTQVVNYTLVID